VAAEAGEEAAVLARLARLVVGAPVPLRSGVGPEPERAVPRALSGWVPTPPRGSMPMDPVTPMDPMSVDARDDVADAAVARTALSAATASYTAAYGHPLGVDEAERPRRIRIAVGARVAVAAVVVLGLVVGAIGVRARQRTPSVTVPAGGSVATAVGDDRGSPGAVTPAQGAQAIGTGAGGTAPAVVVHVVGEVTSPGVVALVAGARVADAVAAAGGPTSSADLAALNLARVLADGEQVVVPAPGQAPTGAAGVTGAGAPGSGSGLVDLNRADAAVFDTLPGIGPVLAERIVAWREEHGRFTAVEELTEVTGIGPALLAGVRDLVQVG